jgi:hypothetical protein
MEGNAGFRLIIDGGDEVDPTLGGPCEDDGQCDDRVSCTRDRCDEELGRCRHEPDDDGCADALYCNGAERCDVRMGCIQGEVVSCSDNSTCTIDTCVEETQSCKHERRDADGDGDPTRNCGGQDCDDANPQVNAAATEVCGNRRDDDCNGETDEAGCARPEHDTCKTALRIDTEREQSGYFDVDLTATALDYPNTCALERLGFRDAVLEMVIPDGEPRDLDVTAKIDEGKVVLGTAASCGDEASAACEGSFVAPSGGESSRLLLRGLVGGVVPIYVAADVEASVQVHVELRPAEALLGDRCEAAIPLVSGGEPLLLRLPAYRPDASSGCEPLTGDAFASFSLETAQDVTLVAESQNGLGIPVLSLRDASCKRELTCRRSQPGRLFVRGLPAGDYRVLVAGTGQDDVTVRLETSAVSEAPPGEGCDDAQPLEPGKESVVDLSAHEDAVFPQCLVGAPDATFGFELEATRDVMLIGRFSDGDEGAVSISNLACDDSRACSKGQGTQRAVRYGLPAGEYRGIIESSRGNPVGLSWLERPAMAAVHVPFADDCDGAVKIPELGGRFTGNTSNSFPDFAAGCDVGGGPEGGAPDQVLKLSLSAARRVVFDMRGSGFDTMLSIRKGAFCPGAELPMACAPGYGSTRSFLDLDLQEGDYFVQIDGYDGASGAWKLDVFTAPL